MFPLQRTWLSVPDDGEMRWKRELGVGPVRAVNSELSAWGLGTSQFCGVSSRRTSRGSGAPALVGTAEAAMGRPGDLKSPEMDYINRIGTGR